MNFNIPASIVALAGLASIAVSFLVAFLKPYIQAIPGLRPNDPLHDSTILLLSFVLNIGAAIAIGVGEGLFPGGRVTGPLVILIALQSLLQMAGSQTTYVVHARSVGSSAAGGAVAAPATPVSEAASAPVTTAAAIVSLPAPVAPPVAKRVKSS